MAKVRKSEGGYFLFFCPGCKCAHAFNSGWQFNGDMDRPTISPSILVTGQTRCHSFVKDGKIQFLGDCTHELAGKTVDLEDF